MPTPIAPIQHSDHPPSGGGQTSRSESATRTGTFNLTWMNPEGESDTAVVCLAMDTSTSWEMSIYGAFKLRMKYPEFNFWKPYFTESTPLHGKYKVACSHDRLDGRRIHATIDSPDGWARHLQAIIADKATVVSLELLTHDGVRPHTKPTAAVVGGPKASNTTTASLPAVPPLDYLRLVVSAGKLTQADVDRYITNEPVKPGKAARPKKQPGATPLDYLAALVKDGHFTQQDVLEYLVGKEQDMVPGLSATMKRLEFIR
ncbi:hypothetical protein B0T24DRAFT_666939 [Lasiosphaeria ovina]|uniref:Uncharacterized protein n=1 Tax=Lasiosphaeria ovina TaxID=92902 RepID=A0AAE0KCP3_9PEZI|nr:hypothetical protein B0T24DRAFT_666939 [Lasiosphaeria ovina]